jgi:hypothetical protein
MVNLVPSLLKAHRGAQFPYFIYLNWTPDAKKDTKLGGFQVFELFSPTHQTCSMDLSDPMCQVSRVQQTCPTSLDKSDLGQTGLTG